MIEFETYVVENTVRLKGRQSKAKGSGQMVDKLAMYSWAQVGIAGIVIHSRC